MKTIIFLTLVITTALIINSCKEDSIVNSNGPGTISGKIENWYYGSDKKLVSYLVAFDSFYSSWGVDTTQISANGEFTLDLITPTDAQLNTIKLFDTSCTNHSVINPAATKWVGMFFSVYIGDSLVGSLSKDSDTLFLHPGTVQDRYYYFNSAGSMTGSDTCGRSYGLENITNLNVNFSKGWNEIYLVFNSLDSISYNVTLTSQQQTVKWYFSRIMYSDKKEYDFKRK